VSAAEPRIVYSPRPDATPEHELNALACVYRFVLERHAARTAAAGCFRPNVRKNLLKGRKV
jgi:hypothetical protein